MSLLAVQGGATGSGTVTLLAPVTNTNRTLTLPDVTGTVLTSATTTGFPAGSVIQVVQGSLETLASTTSATFASTGLSASITPTSTSSKILVLISAGFRKRSSAYVALRLHRGASSIVTFSLGLLYTENTDVNDGVGAYNYLDSPATTSSTTYTLFFANPPATSTVTINPDGSGNSFSTITLMEIAA